MQNVVTQAPLRAYEGMLAQSEKDALTGIAAEMIFFGKAVSIAPAVALGAIPPTVRGYTAGEALAGVAIADVGTQERLADPTIGTPNSAQYGAFAAGTALPFIRKGRVWVASADAIANITNSVWVRNADTAGTPATITDTTVYAVADQDGLDLGVAIAGRGTQTVTFAGATTTAAQVAAQMNAQLRWCSVDVVGGQVVITTDEVGGTVTIAIVAGTSALAWAAPVAGTGDMAVAPRNARGSFRQTNAGGHTEFAPGTGLRWLRGANIGGQTFGLLEVNL